MKATFLGDTMQILEVVTSLPEDIQVDIFIKLPLKSISMSRCVCKLWRNLLSTSKFIKYHHNYNIIQNKNSNHKLISITRGSYSIYSTEYDSVSSSPLPSLNKTIYEANTVEILGSCDGLVCLGIRGYVIGIVNSRYYRICIWNPFTREYKQIPGKSHFQGIKRPNQGFGYDRNLDTYKVVRIGQFTDSFEIHVYTLKSDSWNIKRESKVPYFFSDEYGLLFSGGLHWLGYKTDRKTKYGVIVSFDISSERFGDVPLPAAAEDSLPCEKSVAVLGDYLCLFIVGHEFGSLAEIWVMQKYGVQGSWTKQFSIRRYHQPINKSVRLLCALKNGEILISSGFAIDLKKKIFRELNFQTKEMLISSTARSCYVESLVSPKVGKQSRR